MRKRVTRVTLPTIAVGVSGVASLQNSVLRHQGESHDHDAERDQQADKTGGVGNNRANRSDYCPPDGFRLSARIAGHLKSATATLTAPRHRGGRAEESHPDHVPCPVPTPLCKLPEFGARACR